MADALNGLNPGLSEGNILNPSLSGLGSDPFGFEGYRYHTSLLSKQNARNAAEKEAQYNAKVNYAYWVANNLYNSPTAQMARFEDAGLNPNLIYGKENNVVAGKSPDAHGQVDNTNPIDQILGTLSTVLGAASSINNFRLQNAQVDQARANADLAQNKARTAWFDSTLKEIESGYRELLDALPMNWDDMTADAQQSWIDSHFPYDSTANRVTQHGKDIVYGDKHFSYGLLGLLSKTKKASVDADWEESLLEALLGLRGAQKTNIKAQEDYTRERERYQKYFNEEILPFIRMLKETEANFSTWEHGTGIGSRALQILSKILGGD